MGKMRVYEYAKQRKVSSKEVIDKLKKMNIEVSNHMSSITAETREKLDGTLKRQQEEKNGKNKKAKTEQKTSGSNRSQGGNKPKKRPNQKQKQHANKREKHKNKSQKKQQKNKQKAAPAQPAPQQKTPEHFVYSDTLTVNDLAEKLNKDVSEIIKKLMFLGIMATKNQDLDDDAVELICSDYGVTVEKEIILEDTDFNKYRT